MGHWVQPGHKFNKRNVAGKVFNCGRLARGPLSHGDSSEDRSEECLRATKTDFLIVFLIRFCRFSLSSASLALHRQSRAFFRTFGSPAALSEERVSLQRVSSEELGRHRRVTTETSPCFERLRFSTELFTESCKTDVDHTSPEEGVPYSGDLGLASEDVAGPGRGDPGGEWLSGSIEGKGSANKEVPLMPENGELDEFSELMPVRGMG
ncbi:hypothetical protein NDU88_004709 [Pleurodeles waltl]|uniref:Uncharacterized protein n=1 Tax=Pleurodeles waltl TaxID=8319 RepID=A0AAV7QFL3_PLEWA|nr:hypothetical protein NDU88_004709 [Pleurodeles waltl]